jgi:hypothetical protein
MSITITEDRRGEVHTHSRRLEFEGAAPVLLERRYSHGGKEFIPDQARASWKHGEPITEITVEGFVLKKDRTSGQNRATLRYVTPAYKGYGSKWAPDPAPDWVLELFDINN